MKNQVKKPRFVAHYLALSDLIEGEDIRAKTDTIFYHTSRIENVKCDLVEQGLQFVEDAKKETRFSYYKPYILLPSSSNLAKAKELLKQYETPEVLEFLEKTNRKNVKKISSDALKN